MKRERASASKRDTDVPGLSMVDFESQKDLNIQKVPKSSMGRPDISI